MRNAQRQPEGRRPLQKQTNPYPCWLMQLTATRSASCVVHAAHVYAVRSLPGSKRRASAVCCRTPAIICLAALVLVPVEACRRMDAWFAAWFCSYITVACNVAARYVCIHEVFALICGVVIIPPLACARDQ